MSLVRKRTLTVLAGALLTSVVLEAAQPVGVFEDFRSNPAGNGWSVFGETNLFRWNATNENLEVTWDSSKPNSYFYKPLERTLTRQEGAFAFYFDLRLHDIAIGTTSNKPYTFQVAVGLLNFQQATNAGFLRGTGFDSPNLFEFNYFPDSGFGATISPTIISSNHQFATAFILKEVTTNDEFRIEMRLEENGGRVFTSVLRNGQPYDSATFNFSESFGDFEVDTVAIASYSDDGQFPDFAGSVLAHGTVDNIVVSSGNGFVEREIQFSGGFENGNWRMEFDTMPGWVYSVTRTEDFVGSIPVPGTFVGTNYGRGTIIYTNPPLDRPQFFRIVGRRQ